MIEFAVATAMNLFGVFDLPPKKFDHWPMGMTVMVVNMDYNNELQDFCIGNVPLKKNEQYLGCEAKVYNDMTGLSVLATLPQARDRMRLRVKLENIHGQQWVCLIVLPLAWQLTAKSMNHDYRHELAHCNGWKHYER